MTVLGLLSPHPSLSLPERGVRASRLADLLRVLGVADHDVWRHPELVAAAIALTHRVGRVVVSSRSSHIEDADARVLIDAPLAAGVFAEAPTDPGEWLGIDTTPPTFAGLEVPTGPVQPLDPGWRRRGLYLVPGRAEALVPQHPRRIAVSPGVLAATLFLSDRPTLLPTIDFTPGPTPSDEALELGLCPLALIGPARRVGRGPGFPDRRTTPAPEAETTANQAPNALTNTSASVLPSELWPLRASLAALCERWSYRLPPGEAGMRTLEREAKKLLQAAVAAGHVKGYALAITPLGDDLQDLGMEVVVTLPRRVGQVILRLSPTPRP